MQAVALLLVVSVTVLARNMGKQPNHPSRDLLEFRQKQYVSCLDWHESTEHGVLQETVKVVSTDPSLGDTAQLGTWGGGTVLKR